MTEMIEETDTLEGLDFPIMCGWPGCENKATHVLRMRCCKEANPLCETCMNNLFDKCREILERIGQGGMHRCKYCGHILQGAVKVEDIYEVEAL